MFQRHTKKLVIVVLALGLLTGFKGGGCSDGSPGSSKRGDDFDQDDIRVTVVECAGKGHPTATVRVTTNTSPKDRKYFVGLNFLDSEGNVIDSSSLKLTPESDSDDGEVTAKIEFPMGDPKKASKVDSCKMEHAF